MKFEVLLTLVGDLEWFDLATLVQLTGERRATITNQLSRWIGANRVIALRRGMYVLGDAYRKKAVQPAQLANVIYGPSYITGAFALSFYGLIPERAVVYTCATSKKTQTFENRFGTFEYQHVQRNLFFGYTNVWLDGRPVRMASPEKALVDLWYLSTGAWTETRMREMRFAFDAEWEAEKLHSAVQRVNKPRLSRALSVFMHLLEEAQQGVVDL